MIKAVKTIVVAEDKSSAALSILIEEEIPFSIAKMEIGSLLGEMNCYCITIICASALKWRAIKKNLINIEGVLAYTK